MTIRAKFRLNSYETRMHRGDRLPGTASNDYSDAAFTIVETRTLKLSVVSSGSDENKRFFQSTPTGSLELSMVSPDTWGHFKLNGEYYLDFTPADA